MPDPYQVLQDAREEKERRFLDAYFDAAYCLREKGFTYREIAHWFRQRGIECDHNAVYRVLNADWRDEAVADAEDCNDDGGGESV